MLRGIRRRLALSGAVLAVLSSAACGANIGTPTETVTLALPDLQNPFFQEIRAGAEAAADTTGVRLEVVGARNDAERQARQLRQAVKEGSEAVIVDPVVSPETVGAAVQQVVEADIPVVAVDREVEGASVQSTVASDNVGGGMAAAHAVAAAIDGQGQVIHIQGDPQTSVSADRGEGFEQGIAQYSNIDIATKQPAYFDRQEARRVVARLLRVYPEANAVFAENDQMALGAIDVLGNRAATEVKVVGYDGIPAALQAIEDGTMAATVAQVPEHLGRVAVEQAITVIDGGLIASRVPVAVELVTADNVGQYL